MNITSPAQREWNLLQNIAKRGHGKKDHDKSKRQFFGLPYILLHSLPHQVITAVSLECGYPASSIRERIYAGGHGYGILLRIEQITRGALLAEQGALYPALSRLEHQGLLTSEWGTSDNNRRAKFYRLTTSGRRRLREETQSWNRLVMAIGAALGAKPQEG